MNSLLPSLLGAQTTYLDNRALPDLAAAAEAALRVRQVRAVLAPTVAAARGRETGVWIVGDDDGVAAAVAEARAQGLGVIGIVDPDPKRWGTTCDGVPIFSLAHALEREPCVFLLGMLRNLEKTELALKNLQTPSGSAPAIYSPGGRQTLWSFAEANLPRQTPIPFGIEILNATEIRGFCPRDTPLAGIRLRVDGEDAGSAEIAPEPEGGNGRLEFRGFFAPGAAPAAACTLEATLVGRDGARIRVIHPDQYPAILSMTESRYVPGRDEPFLAPFPYGVALALHRFRPSLYPRSDPWDDATLAFAVADIRAIDRDHAPVAPIRAYLGFLRSMARRFAFVRRRFPRLNPARAGGLFAPDALCGATVPEEILAIAQHLYVLASYGQQGTLAEFGCFKGLSTAMLSLACRETGFRLHVFDSFEGLPGASISGFNQPGEFSGSAREVQDRVAEFGAPEVVQYTQGFFSDTVPGSAVVPACIWLDVDLRTSVVDVLSPLFAKLPRHSCIFSHDISAAALRLEGAKEFQNAADEVVMPIVAAFEQANRPVSVRAMAGFTAAFWETGRGLPVLPGELLQVLVPEPVIN